MTKLCRVVSSNVHTTLVVVEYATSIASAKLKQSQLFERGGTYGIDDACKIEAVQ